MAVKENMVIEPEVDFKREVRKMLVKRNITNVVDMLIWLRSQKQLKVDANLRRAAGAEEEMAWLEEMVAEEESRGDIATDGT